jgi:RNA polymerase sigma factor (sigma-70 family)
MPQHQKGRLSVVAIPPDISCSNGFEDCLKPDVRKLIRVSSQCLVRRLGCPHLSSEDVEQELLIDLWQRWGRFDATRSQERTFVNRVVRNKMVELVRYHNRKKRGRGTRILSLNRLLECRNDDALCHDELPAERVATEPAIDDRTELVADMAALVRGLPDDLRSLCEHLETNSVSAVRRHLGLSKHAMQQEISKLREHLSAADVHRHF